MRIFIFRHGRTTFNRDDKFTGIIDAPLVKSGRSEAKIIAERLKRKKFSVAFQTSLRRSKDTLKIVLKHHPECKKIFTDDRMTERDYGRLNGKTHEYIVKKYGAAKYDYLHRGFRARPPGGESFADVEKRVRSFIKYLKKMAKSQKGSIVISAHGNSIRLFRKILEKATPQEAVSWTIPYDNYYEYVI